jgi:hypothetical protein
VAIRVDEENLKQGLLGLVVAIVEVVRDVLELQALRQIEGGLLDERGAERVADALADLAAALDALKAEHGLGDSVAAVRRGLDRLVGDLLDPLPSAQNAAGPSA